MQLLLDTHSLLWALVDDGRLHPDTREAIVDRRNRVVVSAASAWEIAIKRALGKLRAPTDLVDQMQRAGFEPLDITVGHALAVEALPPHHSDPFDRLLVAQAVSEGLTMVTRDPQLQRYDVSVLSA